MPNPNPVQTEEFLKKRFQPAIDLPSSVQLAKKPRCVKLPQCVDAVIAEMPKETRSVWLRQVICQAALDQGLIDEIE